MKRLLTLALFSLVLFWAWPTNAHITQTQGPISVLLHVEPGDKPKAGHKSVLNFFLSDKSKTFDPNQCDCKAIISRDGQIVVEQAVFTAPDRPVEGNAVSATTYVFKEPGAYQIKLVARPKSQTIFAAFEMTFDQRVEPGAVLLEELSDGAKLALGFSFTLIVLAILGYRVLPWLRRQPKPGHSSRALALAIAVVVATNTITAVVAYNLAKLATGVVPTNSPHGVMPPSGDKSMRYNVTFSAPENIPPNTGIDLAFTVTEAASGNPVTAFNTLFEKTSHLVIVDEELNYYSHVHPILESNRFSINTQLPHSGKYRLYLNFQPVGGSEQQFGFSLSSGSEVAGVSSHLPDTNTLKTFGSYQVDLNQLQIKGTELASGRQKLAFSFKDAAGQNVSTLKPYLGAFGHLVMINQQTYEYTHIHPSNMQVPDPNANGGPTVEFAPMNLTTPIKPGVYRVFGQFNPDNQLLLVNYTIKVN